jgi:hypothetical protein
VAKKKEERKEEELLDSLTHEMAMSVLRKLCADKEVRRKLLDLAEAELRKVDADEVAEEVFDALEALDVEDLWAHSGRTRYGYEEPSEVGHTMAEDAIEPFVRDIAKYRNLGMKDEERETCRGVIRGLTMYENEGSNEFKDWIPDSVMEIAASVVEEYGEHNTEEDTASIKSEMERD